MIFSFPFVEVIIDWKMIKVIKRADCFIFIANNIFVSILWQMKLNYYLVYDADLEDETDKDQYAVNIV